MHGTNTKTMTPLFMKLFFIRYTSQEGISFGRSFFASFIQKALQM